MSLIKKFLSSVSNHVLALVYANLRDLHLKTQSFIPKYRKLHTLGAQQILPFWTIASVSSIRQKEEV